MELIKAQKAPDTGVEAPLSYEDYFVNMGPQHPSTHGVLRLVLKLAGETVLVPEFLYSISGPEGVDSLQKPVGVAVSEDGWVFTVDAFSRTIRSYDTDGEYRFSFNSIVSDKGAQLQLPQQTQLMADRGFGNGKKGRQITDTRFPVLPGQTDPEPGGVGQGLEKINTGFQDHNSRPEQSGLINSKI